MAGLPGKAAEVNKHHQVENVSIESGMLSLVVDGKRIQRELKAVSPLLAAASEEEQQGFRVSPSGYGIHWPLLDEDISIDGLLGIAHTVNLIRRSA
jgi:hypothetical protein